MSLPYARNARGEVAVGGPQGVFDGRMPTAPGDLHVEARGIAPVPEDHRYGGPGRLFTVWFAPNLTMTGVFTGTVGIALGLDFSTALAAVVLGGMGTIAGVLLGATILKLLPEKLRFFSEYRLLLFGLLLVLMMRFRPEGLVANRRRQLEFHEEDEQLAVEIDEEHLFVEEAK